MQDENREEQTPVPGTEPAAPPVQPPAEPEEVVSWYVRPDRAREVQDCYVQPRPMPAAAIPKAEPEKKPHSRRGLWIFLIVLAVMQPNGPNGGYIVSTIASVDPASTASGDLKAGDEILKIDGYHILVRSDFETALSRTASTTHKVTVRREGEKVTLPSVKLEATVTDANGNKRIGITFAELPDSLGMHLSMSVRTAVNYARLVWSSMGMLVSGQVGVDQLAGPVGMAEVMADTAKYSMISFFQLVAFISINLGVMNLLPLPALDGGRLVFLIIEGIRRKPVPPKYEGYVHAAGLMLLLMLMVYVTGQDVLRIFMRSN